MAELTKDNFLLYSRQYIEQILMSSDQRKRAEAFTDIMQRAREFDLEHQTSELVQSIARDFNEPELWELPAPFEKEIDLQPFPVASLPPVLSDYLRAVCSFVQVAPEMAALPLLSVISLCLQGKAVVRYPANAHTEPLNIYTLTIAPVGERKSGTFKAFMKPVTQFVRHYNEVNAADIEQYKAQRQFLERQRQSAMNGKSADLARVKELTDELCKLKEMHELRLIASDATPEALAAEMLKQGGRMAVMDDEGTVFDIVSGIYNSGQANINLLLKSYDGSPHTILRRTSENITLENPLLSMGILTQPQQFRQAMSNPQFSGRGLIQRFIFSFAKGKAGSLSFTSDDIPQPIQKRYDELITHLLKMPFECYPKALTHDKDSYSIFRDYFELMQKKMKAGGIFENMKEYASKHFGKVLRIAGLLHLCEHSADEPINGQTAMSAVNIGLWAENQALLAFDGGADDDGVTRNAKYIVKRLKASEDDTLTLTKLKRLCRAIQDNDSFTEAVRLLEDMRYIRTERIETGGRPSEVYHINPFI